MSASPRAPKRIAVHGAAGRMGIRIMQLIRDDPRAQLVASHRSRRSSALGSDVSALIGGMDCGISLSTIWLRSIRADVIIDFSTPAATRAVASRAASKGVAIVIGTTGPRDRR